MPNAAPKTEAGQRIFDLRWTRSEQDLLEPLRKLYGTSNRLEAKLKSLLLSHWQERPAPLRDLDLQRDLSPEWFLSQDRVGYVFYVDRFASTLNDVLKHGDYLAQLGVNYIHFMPCLKPRPGNSDGGYSVMDYRQIDPRLGTMEDFEKVTAALRQLGMDVCVDLVLNHTAKEHPWALKARAGDANHQNYYWMFADDTLPKAYEETLVEVFPNDAPGNFTHYPEFGRWVWTTFNEHQWDLNWSNPQVYLEIVDIMLNLANKGVTCLRLDAVAFMWKRMGTNCQNLPEVHDVLQALRAATRIVAPALIHKAEAIVAPRDLVPYLGVGTHTGREANLAYHNNLMVQFWSALATRNTDLMTATLARHFPPLFRNASFATYLRCHDDIGWAITDEDAAVVPHVSAPGHRKFLADFYAGQHPGSFARGAIFQENSETGDRRNSGTFASLAGLEAAKEAGDVEGITVAIHRILMGHALICSFGGLPLLYMGDEIGLTNDYGFSDTPAHAHDNRWLHRPAMDWQAAMKPSWPESELLEDIKHIVRRRKALPMLAATNPTNILSLGNSAVFAFARQGDGDTMVCLFNFSEMWQRLPAQKLRDAGVTGFFDTLGEGKPELQEDHLSLPPYGRLWLT